MRQRDLDSQGGPSLLVSTAQCSPLSSERYKLERAMANNVDVERAGVERAKRLPVIPAARTAVMKLDQLLAQFPKYKVRERGGWFDYGNCCDIKCCMRLLRANVLCHRRLLSV